VSYEQALAKALKVIYDQVGDSAAETRAAVEEVRAASQDQHAGLSGRVTELETAVNLLSQQVGRMQGDVCAIGDMAAATTQRVETLVTAGASEAARVTDVWRRSRIPELASSLGQVGRGVDLSETGQ